MASTKATRTSTRTAPDAKAGKAPKAAAKPDLQNVNDAVRPAEAGDTPPSL